MTISLRDIPFLKRKGAIPDDLGPYNAILRKMVGSTEKEFLMIGEKIQEFHGRASNISESASQIAEKISGSEMQDVREGFENMSGLIDHLSGGMQEEKETIHLILKHFEALSQPLSEFGKVVRILNVLCNFIKIEIARLALSDTSFHKLSQDVQQMAGMIESKIKSLVEQAEAAIPSLRNNALLIENSNARQQAESARILENVRARLADMSTQHLESIKTVAEIFQSWKSITDHIGEVVQSLQFHDITRQRVEHVVEALDDLPARLSQLRGHKPGSLPAESEKIDHLKISGYSAPELIADTFELQAAQLEGADHDLTEAVENILTHLRLVARDAAGISEKIYSATGRAGAGDRKEESFIVQLEKDIVSLADSANEMINIRRELVETMSVMSKTAEGMAVFAKDMKKIGIEMQRLALNARVHAAHLGNDGATLGVLADAIHQMSADTASRVSAVTTDLQAVVDSAARLSGMAGAQSDESRAGQENIHGQFLGMSEPLKKIEAQIEEMLPHIEKSGMELSADIEALLAGVRIHQTVGAQLKKVEAYLVDHAGKMAARHTDDRAQKKAKLLDVLSSKYTMHRERTTHNASVEDAGKKPAVVYTREQEALPPSAATAAKPAESDLGDNVELF